MSRIVPISVERDGKDTPPVDVLKPGRLPSLTALAYLFPLILLYWQGGGPSGLLADPSTGVHVRTGQWILSHHAIPRYDLFSFTLPHKAWCD